MKNSSFLSYRACRRWIVCGLKIVKIRMQNESMPTHNRLFNRFSLDFEAAIERQLVDQRIACEQCQQALVDRIRPEHLKLSAGESFCSNCKLSFCGECYSDGVYTGCPQVRECDICLDHLCQDCGIIVCCEICDDGYFCENCRPMGSCDSEACLGDYYCPSCRDVVLCELCGNSWCSECRSVRSCDSCEVALCTECLAVKSCELCERNLCVECDPVKYCGLCEKEHCEACNESGCLRQKKRGASPCESDMPPTKRSRV